MPEPEFDTQGRRILDITPENFRRTNTGAGKGDGRGHWKASEKYKSEYDRIFGTKKPRKTTKESK